MAGAPPCYAGGVANVLPFKVRTRVIRTLVEGNSVRSAARLTKTDKDAVVRLGVTVGEGCKKLHDKLVHNVPGGTYEIDETWGYVGRHERRKLPTDPKEFGDQYTMFAMEADTKFVPSFKTGKRTLPVATAFMADLRARVDGKPQLTVDGWPHWVEATRRTFGHNGAHVGMTVKEYQKECHADDTSRGCGRVKSQDKTVIYGNPDQAKISTSKAERFNLTQRMSDRRLTRLTNAYSKKVENHGASAGLHYFYYNFVRVHESLGTTPAVKAGVADHEWTVEEMTQAALAEMGEGNPPPKGTRPRRYERKTHEQDVEDLVLHPRPPSGVHRAPRAPRAPRAASAEQDTAAEPPRAPRARRASTREANAEQEAGEEPAPVPAPRAPRARRASTRERAAVEPMPSTGCTGRAGCTCPDCAEARFHDAPAEQLPGAPLAKRDRRGERGFATLEALGHVGLVGAGVLAVRRIDDGIKIQVRGHDVPASGVALGVAVAGAALAHRTGKPKAASAAAALAVGLTAGMLLRAGTRKGILAPRPAAVEGAAPVVEPLWKRALRWVVGP